MGWISTPLRLLMAISIPCSWFDLMAGFSLSVGGRFCWGPPFFFTTQPHSENLTRLLPFSSPAYGTWHFRYSCLPGPYCCPELFHWVSLSIIQVNLGGLPPLETKPLSWLIMRWVQQGTSTHKLLSSMGKVCCPLLSYPVTVRIHINIPYFPGLWLHLHLLVIPLCLFFSYSFPPRLCPPSFLPP